MRLWPWRRRARPEPAPRSDVEYELSAAGKVWNRAALEAGGTDPRTGDRHLAALLLAHGLAMNGGPCHAIQALSRDELEAAVAGFVYFGLDEVGALLAGLAEQPEPSESGAVERYGELLPSDEVLVKRYEKVFEARPVEFAPLPDDEA